MGKHGHSLALALRDAPLRTRPKLSTSPALVSCAVAEPQFSSCCSIIFMMPSSYFSSPALRYRLASPFWPIEM